MRVGIIGAGPRGILVTSQLFNQLQYHSEQPNHCQSRCLTHGIARLRRIRWWSWQC